MKESGRIAALAHEEIKSKIKPGMTTLDLDEIAFNVITKNNAKPSFKGYNGFPNSICTSVNEQVIHGIPSKKVVLKEGDIVSVDLGALYKGYHSDVCHTLAVGKISLEDQKLLDVTEQALYEGIKKAIPGNKVIDISKAIFDYIKSFEHNYGIVEEYTGHGLGTSLHEDPMVPNYVTTGLDILLKPGMTIAIEPMINIGSRRVKVLKDNWTVVTIDGKKSAHFEHTVHITSNGCEILTAL